MKKRYVEIITVEKSLFLLHFLPHIFFFFIVVKLITRRSEVQVLPPQPEDLHGRLLIQDTEKERRRSSAVHGDRFPRSHHSAGRMGVSSERTAAPEAPRKKVQRRLGVLFKDHLRRLRRVLRSQGMAVEHQIPQDHMAMQRQVQERQREMFHAVFFGR